MSRRNLNTKRIARRKRRERGVNVVDQVNDRIYEDYKGGHIKNLHPTKGYRVISPLRVLAAGGKVEQLRVFYEALRRAHVAKKKGIV